MGMSPGFGNGGTIGGNYWRAALKRFQQRESEPFVQRGKDNKPAKLKECAQHGYFRAEACPVCGQSGRFLMNDRELDHLGRVLTGILRHFPDRYGLTMEPHGCFAMPNPSQSRLPFSITPRP